MFSPDYSKKEIVCTYFAMEVVEHQMMVGVGVVVHVLQGPEEDMIQAPLEGEGVVGHQGEEDLWENITEIQPSIPLLVMKITEQYKSSQGLT